MTLEDYRTDPELAAFINFWIEHRRCPLELVDWLLDRGLESAAAAARWAATEIDRPVFADGPIEGRTHTGPFPTEERYPTFDDQRWYWWPLDAPVGIAIVCDCVPVNGCSIWNNFRDYQQARYFPTAFDAIFALLSEWVSD